MAVTAATILARVRAQLIDENVTKRWSDDELLRWLSDGQRTAVALDPTLGEVTAAVQLVAGTKQTLPAAAFMLLDIRRNMGTDGAVPGKAVTIITRENMDRTDPDWHASPRSEVTRHYIYDPKTPRTYYVWPPSSGGNYVDLSRAEVPADFTTTSSVMTIPDLYQTALFDYVMFRAHQKDSDYSAGDSKAGVYLQLFQMFLGGHETAQLAASPNQQLAPADLANKGSAQ